MYIVYLCILYIYMHNSCIAAVVLKTAQNCTKLLSLEDTNVKPKVSAYELIIVFRCVGITVGFLQISAILDSKYF